jgi:hypothetical protein
MPDARDLPFALRLRDRIHLPRRYRIWKPLRKGISSLADGRRLYPARRSRDHPAGESSLVPARSPDTVDSRNTVASALTRCGGSCANDVAANEIRMDLQHAPQ